jgi:hypothetical protein
VIAHTVLFRPRPDLTTQDVDDLITAFQQALRDINEIRRASIGRRIRIGRDYEHLMAQDFPFAAILEFDDTAALRRYLEHPSHAAIGARVFASAEAILVYDYEMGHGAEGLTTIAAQS